VSLSPSQRAKARRRYRRGTKDDPHGYAARRAAYLVRCADPANRRARNAYLAPRYGITQDDYEQLVELQGGLCAICRRWPGDSLQVDHDHALGATREAVRGLLCSDCNEALLPAARDRADVCRRAGDYLDDPPARRVLCGQNHPVS
jgi:hypothetical protein